MHQWYGVFSSEACHNFFIARNDVHAKSCNLGKTYVTVYNIFICTVLIFVSANAVLASVWL